MATELRNGASPHPGLIHWLEARHIAYELREHPETFTAEATARAEHKDSHRFAKVVGVVTEDGRHALLVVEAPDHVDLVKAHRALHVREVRVLTEAEFTALAPDCDPGTAPPVPDLCGMPVYADFALREAAEIAFHAGSHRITVHADRAAWSLAAKVIWADLARDAGEPTWAR